MPDLTSPRVKISQGAKISKLYTEEKDLVLMIKRKQRAKRGRRKGRRVPPAHGVSLKVILAHLARYFRREGVDTCLGEVENHGESSQGDLIWEEEEEGGEGVGLHK